MHDPLKPIRLKRNRKDLGEYAALAQDVTYNKAIVQAELSGRRFVELPVRMTFLRRA